MNKIASKKQNITGCVKILAMIALMLIMCISFASCEETPDGMKIASADNVPYSFYAPTLWVTDDNDNLSSAYYPTDDKSNVTVTAYSDSMTIEEYWEMCVKDYNALFSEFTFDESDKAERTLGEEDAVQYTYSIVLNGQKYKISQIITSHDSIIYNFTYTSLDENYDLHLDDVELMIKEFKFR